jgi:nucleotide-binding universal stress UspA family protein
MKTLLVPVDFSGPSDNAAAFAADLANDREYDEIVLAANVYVPIFEQIIPTPDLLQVTAADIQQKKKLIRNQLEVLKEEILNRLSRNSDNNPVQLIIALPGRHSFLYHLTHQNIQQGILRNAQKPVLILK